MNKEGKKKIESFKDLVVWQKGHRLVLAIYKVTSNFPDEEQYGLTSQLRRCAVSITSNIAEGFARKHRKEKIQFLYLALGSLTELQNQITIAHDVGFLKEKELKTITKKTIEVSKLINGSIKAIKDNT
ncbi:MAG: four helix bundle protein [Patescibacteria group bacterium]